MDPALMASVVTTAPLVGFALALLVLARWRAGAATIAIATMGLSFAAAVGLLLHGPMAEPMTMSWLPADGTQIAFGWLLDGKNLAFGAVVALIALAIMLYSVGYMVGERGWSRYFAFLGLFAWAMLSFVFSANLLQMFIFWELVGLASFLLIGFWYEKPAAAAAARKAFIMTRIGDVGLFIGLILLYQATGTLDVVRLVEPATLAAIPADRLTLIALLFFCGVVGKSAQFPLHTWLPDAMEGPTPVSALLHSATMVAAGVFLFARFLPLFMAAPGVSTVVLTIATITVLLSATMAMVEADIKRVLAYSSISQLGFMVLGLAAGDLHAGIFHLCTHAFFKALLFLCAGSYIHRLGSNELVAIGRAGGRSMRLTTVGLLVGSGALAGIPPLAGFFSKEGILAALVARGEPVFVAGAYLGSFLTAYYTFRMVFLVIRPSEIVAAGVSAHGHGGHGDGDHGHGGFGSGLMGLSIAVLSVLAAGAGFFGHALGELIGATEVTHPSTAGMATAIGVAVLGVALAWFDFGRRAAPRKGFIAAFAPAQRLFERRWFIDDLYQGVVAAAMQGVSRLCALLESRTLDGLVDGLAQTTVAGGRAAGRVQSGRLQVYIGASVLFLVIAVYLLGSQ